MTLPWLLLVGFFFWSGIFAYRDARDRGHPPLLVAILVLLICWPLSLLVWLALRGPSRPRFNLDDFRAQ